MEASHEFDYEIINSAVRPIADALIKKFEELRHLEADRILFVVNNKTTASKKRIVMARTSRITEKWRNVLYQLGAVEYLYMVEFYGKVIATLDENQRTALVYSELRRIGPEGQILAPDTNDWWQLLMGLGRHWYYPNESCPNILEEGRSWRDLMGSNYEAPKNDSAY